jgi:hypothetical protein
MRYVLGLPSSTIRHKAYLTRFKLLFLSTILSTKFPILPHRQDSRLPDAQQHALCSLIPSQAGPYTSVTIAF